MKKILYGTYVNIDQLTEAKVVLKNSVVAGVKGMAFKDADAPYTQHENSILLGGVCSPADTSNSLILACGSSNSTDKPINVDDISTDKINNALICGVYINLTAQSKYNNALSFGNYISIGTNTTPDNIGHVSIGVDLADKSNIATSVIIGGKSTAAKNSLLLRSTVEDSLRLREY